MANLALYRKYRSATFTDVIGQEHVTTPLRHALSNGRINHAYLFSGPRGCGKTSSARILARSLNCAQGPTPDPCGECDSCRDLAPNGPGSIDVIEIDAASHGGVDDARDLRERAFFAPVRDRYKVYIIDEAHMVTAQGFNALLKLVEEPPDFLIFIFATTEPDKVLTTIRSRTHHYPFRLIAPQVLRAHLEKICAIEGISVEQAVYPLVVRAGGGSARDSLSILDQLLAGAGPEGVTYERAVGLLGVTDSALLDDMIDALAAGDAAAVYGTVDRVVEAGHDPTRFSSDLLDRFRDLILLDAVPDAFARGLIDAPQDEAERMADQAVRLGGATVTRYAEIVHTALLEMRGTTSPRLVLELLCARMQLPDATTDSAAILQRLERLERRNSLIAGSAAPAAPTTARSSDDSAPLPSADRGSKPPVSRSADGSGAVAGRASEDHGETSRTATTAEPGSPAAPAKSSWPTPPPSMRREPAEEVPAPVAPAPVSTPEPALAAEPVASGGMDGAALRRLWPEVVEVVNKSSKRTRALLDHAQIVSAAGEQVTLSAPPAISRMLGDESNLKVLAAAFTQVVGGTWKLVVQAGAEGAAKPSAAAAPQAAMPVAEPDPRDDEEPGVSTARPVLDPEAEALKLLQDQLGARPVE